MLFRNVYQIFLGIVYKIIQKIQKGENFARFEQLINFFNKIKIAQIQKLNLLIIHFKSMFPFYNPLKTPETNSMGTWEHWLEMG